MSYPRFHSGDYRALGVVMFQIAFYSYSKGVPDGSGQQLRMLGCCLWEKGSRQMQEWTAQVCIQYGTPANALRVCGYRGNWHVVIPLRTSVLRLLTQWSIGEKSPADVQQRLAQLPAFLHLSRFPSASSPPLQSYFQAPSITPPTRMHA